MEPPAPGERPHLLGRHLHSAERIDGSDASARASWARIVSALAACAIALSLATAQPASAQQFEGQLAKGASGPYEITVFANPTSPLAGLGSRITVGVVTTADGRPATDVDVLIIMTRPDGTLAGEVEAVQLPTNSQFYQVPVTLDDPGTWSFTVAAESALGLGTVDGSLTVRERNTSGLSGELLWGVVMVVLVAGGIAVWLTARRRGAQA